MLPFNIRKCYWTSVPRYIIPSKQQDYSRIFTIPVLYPNLPLLSSINVPVFPLFQAKNRHLLQFLFVIISVVVSYPSISTNETLMIEFIQLLASPKNMCYTNPR